MLGKLLKYDLKWIYKGIIVFYVLSILFSTIGRLLGTISNSALFMIISKICAGIAISMIINSLINCFIRLWVRFIRNIYKDESYLTHTLPIEKKTIFLSTISSAILCIFMTTLVIVICLLICFYSKENLEIFKNSLNIAAGTLNTSIFKLIFVISIILFLQAMIMMLSGYLGIILGHKSNKSRGLKSFIYGLGLYMIIQVLNISVLFIYGLFNPQVMNLFNTTTVVSVDVIKNILLMFIGLYFAYIIIFYFIGRKQFEKGVNVD